MNPKTVSTDPGHAVYTQEKLVEPVCHHEVRPKH